MNKLFIALLAGTALFTLTMSGYMFQTNNAGFVQVKQAAGSGSMSVRTQPGVYWQGFGDINEYKVADVYNFSDDSDRISVRFGGDGSTGHISGQLMYRIPVEDAAVLRINSDFRSDDNLQINLIRKVVMSAVIQTATMFTAEEVYSTRRSDFVNLVNEQIKNGIYATTYNELQVKDEDNNVSIKRQVVIRTDKEGHALVSEPSTFKRYGVELVQLVINDVDFDDATKDLIKERKKYDQQKVVAKANAELAKQNAITAEENGKAAVAEAEATANVKKKTAVIQAEQEKEVAVQQALQAEQQKLAIISKGEADARANQLKVAAGLTPELRAQLDKETAIGVAHELAAIKLPETMVIGGSATGATIDPFTAVGLKSFIDISRGLSKKVSE